MGCCVAYACQRCTTSSRGPDLQGFARSAVLFTPAPSQTGGRLCTTGSGSKFANSESGTACLPVLAQKDCMRDAKACARLGGYSAVRVLT